MNSSFFLVLVAAVIGIFMIYRKFRFQQDNQNTESSSLSLTSTPASLSRILKHHVFPSFHGPDVRKTFLSHILEVFRRKGIDPFIDNQIERSKTIGTELVEAIRGSKIAIIMLSRNYASSSWCLDELAEIMKCREVLGQIVMTVFYEVDPTDVRKQTGDFGKAFRKTCKGKKREHIERWRKALEDVAKIAGEHSRNWDNEAGMIEKIATDVSNMLNNSTPSRDFDGLIGIRAHVEKMEHLLCLDSDKVRMIGIWGLPGIGKSTIARVLFNQFSRRFQLSAIMDNIKAHYPTSCLDEYNAQLQLQNKMLSQMINHKGKMISHLGVAQERLKDKKVFLILDDVDRFEQLNALAKETQWFGPGSRIIITTEDLGVLKTHGIKHIYKVNFPSNNKALQIFCMHAFRKKHPDDGFNELAREVTNLAGKLPLGLTILGSALRNKSKQEWERKIPRLRTCLDGKIESIIKFSYDALEDEEKYLFLYIACLSSFHQIPRKVEELLAKKVQDVGQSLAILAEKSLISIGDFGRIEMHNLLVLFGIKTSREQFVIHGRVKHQLLAGEKDICEVLSDDTTDCRHFIGINLDLSKIEEEWNISEKAIESMSGLQFVCIYGNSEKLHSLLYHSQKIRSLHWRYFQNLCLPSTFNTDFLVELVMRESKLHKLWEGIKPLRNLKWMDLSYSEDLKELPDLSTATNLEELLLSGCSNLVELPSSIGNAINLQKVNLRGCSSLVSLPSSIMNIINLRELNLSYCARLVKLPSSIENATNLTKLNLSNCSSLVEFPSIGNANKLEELNLYNCSNLVKLPSSINATSLQKLSLTYCSSVVELPALENATELQALLLYYCISLLELPPIGTATNMKELNISGCSSLVKLPSNGDFTNLITFELKNCSSLLELPPFIGTATNLHELDLSGCSSLVKLPSSVGDIINLREFNLCNCSSLLELPNIGNLQNLQMLRMCGCSKLETLPININLESLYRLDLTDCSQLKSFPEISTNIRELRLIGTAIKEVPLSIMSWSRLSDFRMSYFESLKDFPQAFDIITELLLNEEDMQEVPQWFKGMSSLCELRLHNCNNLVSLPQFSDSISYIQADNCKSLERLDCSFNNPGISLKFTNCIKLNQEARDLIMHKSTGRYEILAGTEVPIWFHHIASFGSLTLKLKERHLPTSLKFKACIKLYMNKEETDDDNAWVDIDIMDKQNDLRVQCTPGRHYIKSIFTDHIFTLELKTEEVTSTELVFEFKTHSRKWKIGECGLRQILDVPEHDERLKDGIDG